MGIDPATGEKNGNGSAKHKKKDKKPVINESLTAITRRRDDERVVQLHKDRLAFHDRQYQTHLNIAMQHARKFDELESRNGGGGG